MKRRWSGVADDMRKCTVIFLIVILGAVNTCDASRRIAQRRKDTSQEYVPAPSVETLSELAEAMGAAEFEAYTEGKALVKRLIPETNEPEQELISHQGVIGKAGVDFPAFPSIPATGFNCKNVPTGYYADLETDCQVFHICDTSRKISFLCPNGTIFSQSHLICDWWFKVDCASSPALYESSAEYYSNEQKKTHKITQSLSKNPDLQQINSDIRSEKLPRTFKEPVPSTTERFLRHRQRLGQDVKTTSRSYQNLYTNPTQKPQIAAAFEKRRKNLVQLIGNNFAPTRTTLPTYTDASTYRTTAPDYSHPREMQIAAESASFASNNNRQYLQNLRPYPVYTPNFTSRSSKAKASPTLTTLFVFDKHLDQNSFNDATTKRPTLLPYTKSYTNTVYEKREPYTRPGVSLLKEFLEKKRNESLATSTEKIVQATARNDKFNNDQEYESVTKIPKTTRSDTVNLFTGEASASGFDGYSINNRNQGTTESASYKERRERIMRKLNLDNVGTTEPTVAITPTEKFGKRPGLVVPPSLTPKTLHTLAIYYATALDNLSTTQPPENGTDTETATTPFDEYEAIDESLPALFSRHTINKYSKLFAQGVDNSDLLEEIKLDPNGTANELTEDLVVQQSQNPLSTSPQIRELAQVFTHALSAYLQDPVKFRKVLSDIRPTQPTFGELTSEENLNTEPTTTVNEEEEEILGFSDENKARPALAGFRESKAYTPINLYPRLTEIETTQTEEFTTTTQAPTSQTTPKNPFRCCGRISAHYTTASTPKDLSTTPSPYLNTASSNALYVTDPTYTVSEDSYNFNKYGGFQNNTQPPNPYGREVDPTSQSKPLSEYVENTNLPSVWGVDVDSTSVPITNSHVNTFESKKIKATTYQPQTVTPIYFTQTDSEESENEEELQRAHSQSFLSPQENNVQRQSKNLNFEDKSIKKPSEELEAPTYADNYETTTPDSTTTYATSTFRIEETEAPTTALPEISSIFTSPDGERSTNQFQWSNNFENWQSTVILDPMTLNDGLSATGPQQSGLSQLASQTTAWAANTGTTPTAPGYTGTSEQTFASSRIVEQTTPSGIESRSGRLLKQPTSTESNLDLTTIAETVVEKAKEIMGEMNATTTEKLMNVMKKTKSKTVRRLILLLVQTCDDDHNSTAEASKRALLEALMTVSQKDMDEIEREQENLTTALDNSENQLNRRTDKVLETEQIRPKQRQPQRSGKSLNFDANAINSLSNPGSTEGYKNDGAVETTVSHTTPGPFTKTTPTSRRGAKKFLIRTSPVEPKVTQTTAGPIAEARVAPAEANVAPPDSDVKSASDTRALELLRSLYTIAAKWG